MRRHNTYTMIKNIFKIRLIGGLDAKNNITTDNLIHIALNLAYIRNQFLKTIIILICYTFLAIHFRVN